MSFRIRQIATAKLLAATLAGTALAEQYVCQTEQVTGFVHLGDEQWVDSRMSDSSSFLVDTKARTVTEFGLGLRYSDCAIDDPLTLGLMICADIWRTGQFAFNRQYLRFARSDIFGYVNPGPEKPWLMIGTCAELGG